MVNDQIRDYIIRSRTAGYNDEQIKRALQNKG
jgi:hypothetical protein